MLLGEGAWIWQRFLLVPLLQVIFWEAQWWALPCFPPLFLGCLKAVAVSHDGPLQGRRQLHYLPGCRQGLSVSPPCAAPGSGRVSNEGSSGVWFSHSSDQLQFAQTAEDRLVEVAAKFPAVALCPVFSGKLRKTAWSLLLYRGDVSFGRPRWFRKPFLPLCGIWCYAWVSILGFLHNMLEGLFCRCLQLSLYESLHTVVEELRWCRIKHLWFFFFFLVHWLTPLFVCPLLCPFWFPCILPPPSCSCSADEFGSSYLWICNNVGWIQMSHSEICLCVYPGWERVLSWLGASFSSSCWGSFPLAPVEAAKTTCWVFDLLATKPTEMFPSPLFCA